MFSIRRIYDDVLPVNKEAIRQVQEVFRANFSAVRPEEVEGLAEKLRNPFKQRFRSILFVAERRRNQVVGFAFLMHEPVLEFCYLDFIATAASMKGRGIGSALYHLIRRETGSLGAKGLFFECLPDIREDCEDDKQYHENVARMRFYERFGARPVIETGYQTPIKEGQRGMPFLMFDGLDRNESLRRDFARNVVRAVLERNFGYLCTPEYTRMVVASFRDDPVRIRAPRYANAPKPVRLARVDFRESIPLVVNDKHDIHHVRERGYVESPVRIVSILSELEPTGLFPRVAPRSFPDKRIRAVHDADFVIYLRKACMSIQGRKSVYPYVFPIRNEARPPKELSVQAGYYCIDTFTPLNENAYLAAKRAVDCTLTAVEEILRGSRIAYALVRPPGHHAERRAFGGFCYFNNGAIAAQLLSDYGKVAIVDVDYHHGNGQEDIFYRRDDVLTVSIHGHPNFAYPYFSGFADARGEGAGEGFNLNLPLPEAVDGTRYRVALEKALSAVKRFDPDFLIVALGLDTARGDPTGTWSLGAADFEANGRMVGSLGSPTLVVQEGGYRTRTLGLNARRFFTGLFEESRKQ